MYILFWHTDAQPDTHTHRDTQNTHTHTHTHVHTHTHTRAHVHTCTCALTRAGARAHTYTLASTEVFASRQAHLPLTGVHCMSATNLKERWSCLLASAARACSCMMRVDLSVNLRCPQASSAATGTLTKSGFITGDGGFDILGPCRMAKEEAELGQQQNVQQWFVTIVWATCKRAWASTEQCW